MNKSNMVQQKSEGACYIYILPEVVYCFDIRILHLLKLRKMKALECKTLGGIHMQALHHALKQVLLVNKKFFKLWNEEYRDGIKTRGDKIGMDLWIIKPLNDVRRKFSANHYAYW